MFNIRKPLVALALLLLAAGAPAFAAGHAAPPSPADVPMQWIASLWQDILVVTGFVDPEPAESQPSADPPAVRSASRDSGGEFGHLVEPHGLTTDGVERTSSDDTDSEFGNQVEPHG